MSKPEEPKIFVYMRCPACEETTLMGQATGFVTKVNGEKYWVKCHKCMISYPVTRRFLESLAVVSHWRSDGTESG